MEEIKQEWRKRKTYWDTFGNLATKEIEDFWLEKIDLAVSKERERIVEMIEKEIDRIKNGDIKWVGLRKALKLIQNERTI